MRIFKLDDEYEIVCKSESTRYGFRHIATLFKNGYSYTSAKCLYYNRTWERYEFESVLSKLISKWFDGEDFNKYHAVFKTWR